MRFLTPFAAPLSLLLAAGSASACSLCTGDIAARQTLRLEARRAQMVLYGTLGNARLGAGGQGSTDLTIERVIKDHAIRAGKQTITLPRYIPVTPGAPPRVLVFCDV